MITAMKDNFYSVAGDTSWTDFWDSGLSGSALLSEDFSKFLEMLEFNLELELCLSAGASVKISQFGRDLSGLVNVFEDMFMFFFDALTLTGLPTFTTDISLLLGPYIKLEVFSVKCFSVKCFVFLH